MLVSDRVRADDRRFNAFFKVLGGRTWPFGAMMKVAADGKAVWSWHPLLVSSRRWCGEPYRDCHTEFANDGDKTNSSPGRARNKPLKPLRRECRVFR